jgi:hypothetical protein
MIVGKRARLSGSGDGGRGAGPAGQLRVSAGWRIGRLAGGWSRPLGVLIADNLTVFFKFVLLFSCWP